MLHPVLFEWCQDKDITVHNVLQINGRVPFDRWLPPILFEEWMGVINDTFSFNFRQQADEIGWKWESKKKFTTKSTYEHLTPHARVHFDHIWKAKIPYKIKIFTWLLEKNAILTKYNLIRRKWLGIPPVSSVIKLKLSTTCSSSALFPGAFGGWSAPVFMLLMSLFATINTDPGSKNGC